MYESIPLCLGDGGGDLPHPNAADDHLQKEDRKQLDPFLFILYSLCGAGGDDLSRHFRVHRNAHLGGGGAAGRAGDRLARLGASAHRALRLRGRIPLRIHYEIIIKNCDALRHRNFFLLFIKCRVDAIEVFAVQMAADLP